MSAEPVADSIEVLGDSSSNDDDDFEDLSQLATAVDDNNVVPPLPQTFPSPPVASIPASILSTTPLPSNQRFSWKKEYLLRYVLLCTEQVRDGVLINMRAPIVKAGMANILPQLQEAFPGVRFTATALFNKYRSLLSEYRKVRGLLKSGVGYNNASGIVSTTEDAWKEFVALYKNMGWVKSKGFLYMDEMDQLWPNETATGAYITEADDANDLDNNHASEEEDQLSQSQYRRRRRDALADLDPDLNPAATEAANDLLQGLPRAKKSKADPRVDAFISLGASIENGMTALANRPFPSTAQRSVGSDDISAAIKDFQEIFSARVGNRVVARVARFFAKDTLEAVAWLSIQSVSSKEEFLREAGFDIPDDEEGL
ncbi:hypothetical protein CGMCC3_g9422 [Colletotrichum fructicola]|uniref:Myb/SANT-like domain-containing protein n=1 Tax=Colletotrichum fructicola (strain Nara gc5) TaxID=1213859 RepID=L2FFH0_COLFN|nr:uncharacterized protein CGMCC3_g9422 [Colletotrichum fructicola]KAF4474335.1 hypothetical protein CGGC5_v016508 [Colletotrichum fructicola Nara gc5]KAE9574488.1 hypothetical protein CGMCC3_g9422 [Colletotrichum fructicola]KAF4417725.1 hypothetical protein CFRS1_v015999 [Colletotrichum fructicola]KAF4881188.1 hypothetical protein CGCFRS4_v015808 [Colletotrichum fructicola]KAF4921050.1 hypothetical protein CGCF245_v015659 [Colletotrichum fructicola]